jgi:hypothetical protein
LDRIAASRRFVITYILGHPGTPPRQAAYLWRGARSVNIGHPLPHSRLV